MPTDSAAAGGRPGSEAGRVLTLSEVQDPLPRPRGSRGGLRGAVPGATTRGLADGSGAAAGAQHRAACSGTLHMGEACLPAPPVNTALVLDKGIFRSPVARYQFRIRTVQQP